jgi:hypothetical protein
VKTVGGAENNKTQIMEILRTNREVGAPRKIIEKLVKIDQKSL